MRTRDPPAAPVGGPADGPFVGPLSPSSPPVEQTVAQSGAVDPTTVAGLRVGAVVAGCLGSAGGDPVAAGVDGQRALLTPPSLRNPASEKLFRPLSRACTGGYFALKAGSCSPRILLPSSA